MISYLSKMNSKRIGIIGSGSWATAIAKIVTDNGHAIHWWVRQANNIEYFKKRQYEFITTKTPTKKLLGDTTWIEFYFHFFSSSFF